MAEAKLKDTLCETIKSRLQEIEIKLENSDEALDEVLEPLIVLLQGNSFILLTFYKQVFDITIKLLRMRVVTISSGVNELVNILQDFHSTFYSELDWLNKEVKFNKREIELGVIKSKEALQEALEAMNIKIEGNTNSIIKLKEETKTTRQELETHRTETKEGMDYLEETKATNKELKDHITKTKEGMDHLEKTKATKEMVYNLHADIQRQNKGNLPA